MDNNLKREIILENYKYPFNRGLIEDETYIKVNTSSDSCIDDIDLMLKIENGKIIDAKFDGEACAICTSSTSIMIKEMIGKTIEEAKIIYDNFSNMINGEQYNEEVLEEANVYSDIHNEPNRIKCALLPWWGLKKVIDGVDKNGN